MKEDERKGKFTAKLIITKDHITESDFCFCDRCRDDVRDRTPWLERMRVGSLDRNRDRS